MEKTKILVFIVTWILFFKPDNIYGQEDDTLNFSALNRSKMSFLLDDMYIMGGIALSGIYYSNHFRQLSSAPGFSIGIGNYFPLKGIAIANAGVAISQRNFLLHTHADEIRISNLFLDVPIIVSFELPILKRYDFRILLGTQGSYRLNSVISGEYNQALIANPDLFRYRTTDFNNFDVGWLFGLSMEYRNVMIRFKSYSGFVKLDNKDQGMLSSFNLELGYFAFRNIKRK